MKKSILFLMLFCTFNLQIFASVYKNNVTASYYAEDFHGKKTSNGEYFNMNDLTCAHKSLPFNTILKVTNLANGKSVNVRVNDRGPFVVSREIDLSKAVSYYKYVFPFFLEIKKKFLEFSRKKKYNL